MIGFVCTYRGLKHKAVDIINGVGLGFVCAYRGLKHVHDLDGAGKLKEVLFVPIGD